MARCKVHFAARIELFFRVSVLSEVIQWLRLPSLVILSQFANYPQGVCRIRSAPSSLTAALWRENPSLLLAVAS
jgi:hypothetical protein